MGIIMAYYSAKKLTDRDGDGKIATSRAYGPYKAGDVLVFCPDAPILDAATPYAYVKEGESMLVSAAPKINIPLLGASLSGCEFDGVSNGALCPTPAMLRAYIELGMAFPRIPFRRASLRNASLRESVLPKLVGLANEAISLGVPILFDRHDYAWPSVESQIDDWADLLDNLPKSDLIQVGWMNEPKGFDDVNLTNSWEQWARDIKLCVHGFRARGYTNHVWVQYPMYSGINRFDKKEASGKATESAATALRRIGNIEDPLNLTGIEGHRYFDETGAGESGYGNSTTSGFTKFAAAVAEFGMPAMIGESAFPRGVDPDTFANKTLAEISAGIPNLYAIVWWGAGRGWKSTYHFYTPADGSDAYVTRLFPKPLA